MSIPPNSNKNRPDNLDEPYIPGDGIPAPEAVEKNSDTDWALWSDLAARQNASFAPTAPSSLPMPLPETAGEGAGKGNVRPAAPKSVTLEEVMLEARRNNRVCPLPERWQHLYDMLPDKKRGSRGWQPSPPLTGSAWIGTPSLSKRMSLRDHIEWAASHGRLDEVFFYLKQLPEDEWHHMDD